MIENQNLPFELYVFEGSHARMGRSQGRELKKMIRDARKLLGESEELGLMKPSFIPTELFILLGSIKTWLEYSPPIRKHYPEQYKRLKALARGAGVFEGFITLLNSFEVELNKVDFVMQACSAAGVTGARSATGEPIIYKNFDYPAHFTPMFITKLDKPKDRNQVLSVSAAPLAGNHDGINEHGLCVCYNYGYGQDGGGDNVPLTIAVQETLETCRTTSEACAKLADCKRSGGALMMICDAAGDLRALEMSNSHSAIREPDNGFIAHTNNYHDPEMAKIDVPPGAVYSEKNVAAVRGEGCSESSEIRCNRIMELLSGLDSISDGDLLAAFSDHGEDGEGTGDTVCRHSEYYTTTCSVVYYPARRGFKVMYGSPCSGKYKEFGFDNI